MTQKPQAFRKVVGQRLAFFIHDKPDDEHWDVVWEKILTPKYYDRFSQGLLDEFERPFIQHLSKTGKILEAGCGLGRLLLALHVRGYQIEGIDWASNTVNKVKSLFPDLAIRQGDVTHIDAPDETYQSYISMGVMEHREEGPEAFLVEAHRVLAAEGKAVITVPYFNWLRRLKVRFGLYQIPNDSDEGSFYQYAFRPGEFIQIADQYGFQFIESYPYSGYKGFKDELPFIAILQQLTKPLGKYGGRIQRFTEQILTLPIFARLFGHMIMLVFQKK